MSRFEAEDPKRIEELVGRFANQGRATGIIRPGYPLHRLEG